MLITRPRPRSMALLFTLASSAVAKPPPSISSPLTSHQTVFKVLIVNKERLRAPAMGVRCEGQDKRTVLQPGQPVLLCVELVDDGDQSLLAREGVEADDESLWGQVHRPWPVEEGPPDGPDVAVGEVPCQR